ncbi:MAG: alpha/beta hydrolase, partial [Halobacteria archaeon]|nr:alpha/beta hydrolase [Halobacteria archaeon]
LEADAWDNWCAARILLTVGFYRPVAYASEVEIPSLVVKAENDSIIPVGSVENLIEKLDADVFRRPAGHFDVYTGDEFERVVEREAEFLRDELSA